MRRLVLITAAAFASVVTIAALAAVGLLLTIPDDHLASWEA